MNNAIKYLISGFLFLSFMFALCACKDGAHKVVRLEVLEIFKVEGDEATKRPTDLRYKDVKNFNQAGSLVQQNFYHVDNSLKGYEFINRDGNKAVTNYYSADSTLLAIYNLEYNGKNISKRVGYDGMSKELLRTELYSYDKGGNMTSKTILDQAGNVSGSYSMNYDSNGNEILFKMMNAAGELRTEESFVITKTNSEKLWTERWGYVDGKPNSFHRRSFSYN